MEWWQALLLGVIQGLAEPLPISSSGHLILAQNLMQLDQVTTHEERIAFDVALHGGTLLAVFAYFREDLLGMWKGWLRTLRTRRAETDEERLAWLVILGTVPAVLAVLVSGNFFAGFEDDPVVVASMLVAFSFVFLVAERFRGERVLRDVRWRHALAIGCGQALALVPGTSRSGATISTAMFLGFRREAAARFSFLLSAPVVLAALIKELPDMVAFAAADQSFLWMTLLGFAASGIVGFLAIGALLRFLAAHSLGWFALYRIPLGLLMIWYFTAVAS